MLRVRACRPEFMSREEAVSGVRETGIIKARRSTEI